VVDLETLLQDLIPGSSNEVVEEIRNQLRQMGVSQDQMPLETVKDGKPQQHQLNLGDNKQATSQPQVQLHNQEQQLSRPQQTHGQNQQEDFQQGQPPLAGGRQGQSQGQQIPQSPQQTQQVSQSESKPKVLSPAQYEVLEKLLDKKDAPQDQVPQPQQSREQTPLDEISPQEQSKETKPKRLNE